MRELNDLQVKRRVDLAKTVFGGPYKKRPSSEWRKLERLVSLGAISTPDRAPNRHERRKTATIDRLAFKRGLKILFKRASEMLAKRRP